MSKDIIEYSQPIGDRSVYTTCYMCACRCGIKVHLKDVKLRYIEGNRDHPVNRGVLCGKGSAGIARPVGRSRANGLSPSPRYGLCTLSMLTRPKALSPAMKLTA